MRSSGPYDAHDTSRYAGHAETEHHPGHDEFMASPLVELEYRHVGDGTTDEEEEEYDSDRDVGMYRRYAAQAGGLGRVWSMLRHLLLKWRLAICVL